MGDIISGLFGGSKNKSSSSSTSGNQAFNYLQGALSPAVGTGISGMSSLADFLGLGGADGTARAGAGLQNYMNSAGYQNLIDASTRAIGNSAAAKGLFQSGATGQAISKGAQDIAQQGAQNYLGNLQALAQLGLGAANTIGGAGQTSSSTSTGSGSSSNGIFKSIPIFSDRRLKRDIVRIGATQGIPLYKYRYVWGWATRIGVMAQDVKQYRPKALGPKIFGYMTVRYDRLFAEG